MGLIDGREHRMTFPDEQPPTGPEQPGNDPSPTCDVGQPAESSDARVDKVERGRLEHLEGTIDIGLDILDRRPSPLCETARLGERCRGEIEAGHLGAEARERDRVGPDVALKMHAPDTGELAEPGSVETDHRGEKRRIRDETLDGVVRRGCMCRSPLIPVGPVDLEVVPHLHMMSQARARQPLRPRPRGRRTDPHCSANVSALWRDLPLGPLVSPFTWAPAESGAVSSSPKCSSGSG